MISRDEFRASTIREIAQRSGYRCSCPTCLRPTSGPDGGANTANIGVAAHICAAAPGGPRYDASQSPDERSAAGNGIWLCQTCSRLIDVDIASHSREKLYEWKTIAEMRAYLGLRGLSLVQGKSFPALEAKLPALVGEMRVDLRENPFIRTAMLRWKKFTYGGMSQPSLVYFHEDHEHLQAKVKIMANYGAVIDTSYGDVNSLEFTEDFVEYLELPIKV